MSSLFRRSSVHPDNIRNITDDIRPKEGFAIVAFGWIASALLGALPFYLSGAIPSLVDCVFETVSGYTTTGASILENVIPISFSFHPKKISPD